MKTYTVHLCSSHLHPRGKTAVDADYFEVEEAGSLVFYRNLPVQDDELPVLEHALKEPVAVCACAPGTWIEVVEIGV